MTELMKRALAKLTNKPQTLHDLGAKKVTMTALVRAGFAAEQDYGYVLVHKDNDAPILHTSTKLKQGFGDKITDYIKKDAASIFPATVGCNIRFNLPNGREVIDSISEVTENIFWLKSGMVVLRNDKTLKLEK